MGKRWIICKVSQAAQSPTYWWFCIGTPICSSFSNLHPTFDVETYFVYGGTLWFRVKQSKCLLEWIIILPKISRNNASDIENKNEKKCEGGEDVMRWRRKTNDSKSKIYAGLKQADFLLIVQMLIWQILKCCSKYVFVPNLCHIPPPPCLAVGDPCWPFFA